MPLLWSDKCLRSTALNCVHFGYLLFSVSSSTLLNYRMSLVNHDRSKTRFRPKCCEKWILRVSDCFSPEINTRASNCCRPQNWLNCLNVQFKCLTCIRTAAKLSVIRISYSGQLSFNFRTHVAPILKTNKPGLCWNNRKLFFFTTFSFSFVISLLNCAYELNRTEIGEELIQ